MRKLDVGPIKEEESGTFNQSHLIKHLTSNSKIETTLEVIENFYPRLIVRSNTCKKYTIVLNDDPYQAKCSCPSWIFRGAKLAREAGKAGREPCKHIRAIKVTEGAGANSHSIGQRFSILDF